MRPDLNKLLCERERVGSTDKYKNYRRLKKFNPAPGDEGENLPFREGTKFRYGYDGRSFNENLSPLRGAIRANLGKRWDTFYSELCKNFDKRSVINQHILQHLFQYVEREVYIENGEVWVRQGKYSRSGDTKLRDSTSTEYYVDPRDGIMKKNKWYKGDKQREQRQAAEQRKAALEVIRWIDDDNVLHNIDGVWFHFTMEDVPEGKLVYDKPTNTNEFNIKGYGAAVMKSWEQLDDYQRSKYGSKRFIGGLARDLFTGNTVYRDRKGAHIHSYGPKAKDLIHNPPARYHATKKTASHQTLKKAGVV